MRTIIASGENFDLTFNSPALGDFYGNVAKGAFLPIADVERAILTASFCIKRRNIGADYTNISLMGAFVCIKAGELLQQDELFSYGRKRLLKAWQYANHHGAFTEYNSPTYSLVALEEIGRMLRFFQDQECYQVALQLNDLAWRQFAMHYHPASGQLAAPHARCYATLQGKKLRTFIFLGTERGRFREGSPPLFR